MELTIGAQAPRLTLQGPAGPRTIPAAGRAQAVFFFKVDCPTCPLAAPAVERLRKAYPGLDVVAVSQDAERETQEWMRAQGLDWSVAALEGERYPVSAAFGLAAVPTLVLVDGGGAIVAAQEGWSRDGYDALAKEAARLLGATPVAIAPADGPAWRPG
ncbi:MAG TPA: TlpA disulfide reductase family protein [Myxococcales bacterium]|jgi:peroxiredoxin